MKMLIPVVLCLLAPLAALAQSVVKNGSFEESAAANLDAAGLVAGWKVNEQGLVPVGWQLNSHYTGTLDVRTDTTHKGKAYARLTGGPNSGHLY